ncbi:hypothetical protein, partial [Bradyrhizobium liaoningense]|uniref:hypothetical protein n=1 Tax=Bradyrhizobium liaoningense TaxID=43992 RepID=UPI001BA6FDF7
IRSKNPRRCQAENPLKLLSEFAGPALRDQENRRKIYGCVVADSNRWRERSLMGLRRPRKCLQRQENSGA